MKLISIELKDFRSFYGTNKIEISTDLQKNVTLIIAQNETGKTNILNALRLCFHNQYTKTFKDHEQIINFRAKDEGNGVARVVVEFEHENETYKATRTWDTRQTKKEWGLDFTINKIVNGSYIPQRNISELIAKILPVSMSEYFMFDGEYAVHLTDDNNIKELRDSTQDILGTQIVDLAIKDLRSIQNKTRKKLNEREQSEDIKKLNNQIEKNNLEISRLEPEIIEAKKKSVSCQNEIQNIESKLKGAEETAPLAKEQEKYKEEKTKHEGDLLTQRKNKIEWLREYSQAILSNKLTIDTEQIISAAKASGKIPADYTKPFVEKILRENTCICGRPFEAHSPEEIKISALQSQAGSVASHEYLIKARSRLDKLKDGQQNFLKKFQSILKNEKRFNADIADAESEIFRIDQLLKNMPNVEGLQEKMNKRDSLSDEFNAIQKQLGALEHQKTILDDEVKKLDSELESLLKKEPENDKIRNKLKVISTIIDRIELVIDRETENAKKEIEKKMNNLLMETRKNEVCHIDDNFKITLKNKIDNRTEPKSTGKTNLLSLVYISALLEFCKDRKDAKESFLINGTSAPLILDSPFATLDDSYDKICAKFIPKMTDQVILILNKKSYESVSHEIKDKVGSVYFSTMLSSKKTDSKDEMMKLFDKEVPLTKYNQEYRYTEINRIEL